MHTWGEPWKQLEDAAGSAQNCTQFSVCANISCVTVALPLDQDSASFSLTSNHFRDSTSVSSWSMRIQLSCEEASCSWDNVGSITCQTLPLLGGQQSWAHLQAVALVLLASSPPNTSHPRFFPTELPQYPVHILTAVSFCIGMLYFQLPAPSTGPPYTVRDTGMKEWVSILWEDDVGI